MRHIFVELLVYHLFDIMFLTMTFSMAVAGCAAWRTPVREMCTEVRDCNIKRHVKQKLANQSGVNG